MTVEEALKYYGTAYKLTKELKVSRQCYTNWKNMNHIPPLHQYRLEKMTDGVLKADDDFFNKETTREHWR